MARLTVADDEEHLTQLAAERFTQLVDAAVADRGVAFVSLTGGNTPRRLYSVLADVAHPWRSRVPWQSVHLFWGDERHVPPDHPDSNYGMAKETLIDHIPIPPSQVHRIRGEFPDAQEAAADYERTLTAVVSADVVSGFSRTDAVGSADVVSAFRRTFFDVMLLGLGEDAHIASIFPGSDLLRDVARPFQGRRVAAVWAPHLDAWRITLTPAAILDSRAIVMLVAGEKKAVAVQRALAAPLDVTNVPAQLLRAADDRVEWLLDRAAASALA